MKLKLTEEQIKSIKEEFELFKEGMYAGRSPEERNKLDQFFTPPELTIQMLETYDIPEGKTFADITILDPTCGSGNLLVACILAGADPKKVYGNEYDQAMVDLCRTRLHKYGVRANHIHRGNALQHKCLTDFSTKYLSKEKGYQVDYIDDLDYAQKYDWEEENKQAKLRHDQQNQTEEELW